MDPKIVKIRVVPIIKSEVNNNDIIDNNSLSDTIVENLEIVEEIISTPALENRGLDTHYYDDKLHIPDSLREDCERVNLLISEFKDKFDLLMEILLNTLDGNGNKVINIHGINCFNAIVNDFTANECKLSPANHEVTFDLHAEHLFYILYEKLVEDQDLSSLVCEQLNDMITGFCVQGRVTRPFSILVSFYK